MTGSPYMSALVTRKPRHNGRRIAALLATATYRASGFVPWHSTDRQLRPPEAPLSLMSFVKQRGHDWGVHRVGG